MNTLKTLFPYLVPKHCAEAVGRRTKLAQKQKKIDHTQMAKAALAPPSAIGRIVGVSSRVA